MAIGIVLGGERLTPPAMLGAVLMLAGTYWGQSIERTHRAVTAATAARENESRPTLTPTSA